MVSMDLYMLRLRYLLDVCYSKAQGKFWTEVSNLEVKSIQPVVEAVVKDEITQ